MKFIKLSICILAVGISVTACHSGSTGETKTDSVGAAAPVPGPDAMPSPADSIAPVPITADSQNAANTEAANAATEAEKEMDGNKK